MSFSRALIGVVLLGVGGCGQAGPEITGQESQAIFKGYPSGVEDDGVVKVTIAEANGASSFCSGSLLAPNVVLTARHCVSNLVAGQFTCTDAGELTADSKGGRFGSLMNPSDLKISVGAEFKEPLAALGAKVFATQTPTICRNDLAVIVLDREITGVPLLPIRIDRGNQRGESLRVVGFGETEEATLGVRHAKDGLKISQVGTSQFRADGDPIPPRTFLTVGPALCKGDSGGPALTSDGAVTGVYSQLVETCSSPNARQYFTQVAPFADEILVPAFELAGYEPITEGAAPSEAGAGGESGSFGGAESIGGAESAGAPPSSAGGSENGTAGSPPADPEPPEKGGCRCATTATPKAGFREQLATALLLAAAGGAISRRRRRGSERCP